MKRSFFLPLLSLLCLVTFSACSGGFSLSYTGTSYKLKAVPSKQCPADAVAWYFPETLRTALASHEAGTESLSLFVDLSCSGAESVSMAFIYDNNEIGKGGRISDIPATSEPISVSLGVQASGQIPVGFIIQYGGAPEATPQVTVSTVRLENCRLGWGRTPVVTYGFGKSGGAATYSETCPAQFDFSDAVGPATAVVLTFERQPVLHDQLKKVNLFLGSEPLSVLQSPALSKLHLYPSQFQNSLSQVRVSEGRTLVSSLFYVLEDHVVGNPIPADPGVILSWPADSWENPAYQLYRWEILPQVLIFDFADYGVQDDMLKRLAFFTEKAGFKGRLAPDEEIADLHGYNAHDYRAESLAAFYNKAAEENFPLNQRELELLSILVDNGLLIATGDDAQADASAQSGTRYTAGNGAIISISKESSPSLRRQLITHEAYHALFFSDEGFRSHVATVYDTMDHRTLEFLLLYFKTQKELGYDTDDRYLMHTELMSYLLQHPQSYVANYFIQRSNFKSMFTADEPLCDYIKETEAAGFVEAHQRLEEYVFRQYGLQGGRVNLVQW